MLIVWIVLALTACVLSGVGTALFMRARFQRERLVAEIEDPRDSHIRELLAAVKVARESTARATARQDESSEELTQAHDRIRVLEKTAANALNDVTTLQGRMESLLGERNQLEEALAGMRRENEGLRNRAQELEVELSMGGSPDLLDPGLQAS